MTPHQLFNLILLAFSALSIIGFLIAIVVVEVVTRRSPEAELEACKKAADKWRARKRADEKRKGDEP
jgi:hypothetical protein